MTVPDLASGGVKFALYPSGIVAGGIFMTNISTQKNRSLVQMALFGAIIVLLAFTPFIGYIPLGFTKATIIHIPVILASLLLGPKKGAILGALFGLTSLISNTFQPTPTSFVFHPFIPWATPTVVLPALLFVLCLVYW